MLMSLSPSSQVLSKYRSGKLPKAFKIIPALSNWEQILYVTEPEAWTAAAMYQATRWSSSAVGWSQICRCGWARDMQALIQAILINNLTLGFVAKVLA